MFQDASHNIKVLLQMYHMKFPSEKRIKIKNPRYHPSSQQQDVAEYVTVGDFEVARLLSWRYVNDCRPEQPEVIPQIRYSHLSNVCDFGPVTDQGSQCRSDASKKTSGLKRYACVENVLGGKRGLYKASGITLLPSESFSRIVMDLICYDKTSPARRHVTLAPGWEGIKSVKIAGDAFSTCAFAKNLTLDDWRVINKTRKVVSGACGLTHTHPHTYSDLGVQVLLICIKCSERIRIYKS